MLLCELRGILCDLSQRVCVDAGADRKDREVTAAKIAKQLFFAS